MEAKDELVLRDKMWGAMLSISQRDLDSCRMVLSGLFRKMQDASNGIREGDVGYHRFCRLMTLVGGMVYQLQGIDGVMTATCMDLLSGGEDDSES